MEGGTGFEPVNNGFADRSVSLFATRPNCQQFGAFFIITAFNIPDKAKKRKNCIEKIKRCPQATLIFNGAEEEIRTLDPRLGKAMLYH